jgi:hypothetical protein
MGEEATPTILRLIASQQAIAKNHVARVGLSATVETGTVQRAVSFQRAPQESGGPLIHQSSAIACP